MSGVSLEQLTERLLPRSLHYQLALLFALLFAASIALYAKYTGDRQHAATVDMLQQQALAWTRSLADELASSGLRSRTDVEARMRRMFDQSGADAFVWADGQGRPLVTLRREGGATPLPLPEGDVPEVELGGLHDFGDRVARRIILWVPLQQGGRSLGWIYGEFDTRPADAVRERIFRDSFLVGVVTILAATLLVLVFLRGPMASLRRATGFASRLDREFGTITDVGRAPEEIAELAEALNWASLRLFDQNAALVDGEMRKSAILRSALDCIIAIDEQGRVTEFNPAAEATFGWTREEMLGASLIDRLVPARHREANLAILRRYAETRHSDRFGQRLEVRALRRDGGEFPAEVVVVAMDLGERLAYTVYLRDITERKRAEQALLEAKEVAEAANRAKGEFLANMSHEIRTPMNGIIGMTELVLDSSLDDEQREHLRLVKASADALLEIINEILDFSKIESGHIEFESIPFNLRETVELVTRTLTPRAREKGLALAVDMAAGLGDHWRGDPLRIRQVLTNLVGNALKFTASGRVDVLVGPDPSVPGHLHFRIRDTGIGIPAEKLATIFDPFAQADSSTTRKYGGTGLGLTISQRLVNGMGGRLWVDSEVGRGSCFHFSLPLAASAAGAAGEGNAPAWTPAVRRLHVLLAEDNPVNQRLATHLLTRCGHTVDVVGNGAEAVAALRGKTYDLVLMDIEMPEMDGLAATRAIRAWEAGREGRRTPIIALTAHAMAGDRQRCLDAGMDAHVTKPIQMEELKAALRAQMMEDAAESAPAAPAPAGPLFDRAAVLRNLGDDGDLLDQLCAICRRDLPEMRMAMGQALAGGDGMALAKVAHAIKGMVANFGAAPLVSLLGEMEQAARAGRLASVRDRMPEAAARMDALLEELAA